MSEQKVRQSGLELAKLSPAVGFNNCGAVCYMNAEAQALLSCSSFNNFVSSPDAIKSPVTAAFANHLKNGGNNLGNQLAPEFARHSNMSTLSSIIAMWRNDEKFKKAMGQTGEFLARFPKERDPMDIARELFSSTEFGSMVDPLIKTAASHGKGKVLWEGNGWQDSQEAMIHILEATGADKSQLFRLDYDTFFKCMDCGYLTITETSESARPQDCVYLHGETYDAQFSRASLQNFTKSLNDEDMRTEVLSRCVWWANDLIENSQKYSWICPKCEKPPKMITKARKLSRVNSIICIFMPQFKNRKKAIPLTKYIRIPAAHKPDRSEQTHYYRFVSQVEYTGGHYYAHALRNDDKVYCLNDSSVRPSNLDSTLQTVLAFYHYEKTS